MERSLHSARACFIENLAGVMTTGEMAVLDSWYSLLTREMDMEVDLVIYLRTSPGVAMSRVQGRSRDEEMQIPEQFFIKMHQLHEVKYDHNSLTLESIIIMQDWLIHRNSSAQVTSKAPLKWQQAGVNILPKNVVIPNSKSPKFRGLGSLC